MLDVLVPYRGATEHRQELHDYTQRLWSDLAWTRGDIHIHVAGDGQTGPVFSVAKAVNNAWRQGSGEYVMIFGSGHAPPTSEHLDGILDRLTAHVWTACFESVRMLSEKATRRLLAGESTAGPNTVKAGRTVGHCMGILAMRRHALEDVGGMDERFNGWGYEDTALRDLLTRAFGPTPKPNGALTTLWHPLAPRKNVGANRALYRQQAGIPASPEAVSNYLDARGRFL